MRARYYAAGWLFLLWLVAVPALRAQESSVGGFAFLRLDPSARATALGGLFPDWQAEDVGAVFFNPAILNPAMHRQLSLSYLDHLAGIRAGTVVFGWEHARWGMFALGLRYLSYGEMSEADAEGNVLGTFGASDGGFFLSAAREVWQELRAGIQVGTVFTRVASARGMALTVDAGLSYIWREQAAAISASLHHAGVVLQSLGVTPDRLPVDLRLGISKRLAHLPLVLGLSAYRLNAFSGRERALYRHLIFSGEFRFSPAFQVRIGYNPRRHADLKIKSRLDMAGFSGGFGIRIRRFTFDYAYASWSSLGALHHFSLRTRL